MYGDVGDVPSAHLALHGAQSASEVAVADTREKVSEFWQVFTGVQFRSDGTVGSPCGG